MRDHRHAPEDFGIGRLFRDIRDAIIVGNARTERIVLWNPCAESIFGYTEEEALKLHLHDLVPENLRTMHRTGLARYQETGGGDLIDSGTPVELPGIHKDGHEVPIELTLTVIPDTGVQGDRYALAIVRDVTERKTAELERLKLERMQLSKRQALELNDTIVQGLAVAKMFLEEGESDRGLAAVSNTLERAKQIVRELLRDINQAEGITDGGLVRGTPADVSGPLAKDDDQG